MDHNLNLSEMWVLPGKISSRFGCFFLFFICILHVTTSPISFLCLRTHHICTKFYLTTTAFVSHQSYSSVNHLLQCFCLFVCICLFDFFLQIHTTTYHLLTYLLFAFALYIPLLHKMPFDFNLNAKIIEKNVKENDN